MKTYEMLERAHECDDKAKTIANTQERLALLSSAACWSTAAEICHRLDQLTKAFEGVLMSLEQPEIRPIRRPEEKKSQKSSK